MLGKYEGIMPLMMLILNYFPLSKTYTLLIIYIMSSYTASFLKYFYQAPRPFYLNNNITAFSCDSDYGSPSGHGYAPTVFYLSILTFLKEYAFFRKNQIFFYVLCFVTGNLILMLLFSRFLLGVHALNQIIFGLTLGIGSYFLVFEIFDVHSFVKGANFFQNFIIRGSNILWYSFYFTLIIFSLLCYGFFKFDHSYLPIVIRSFPELPPYKLFENYELAMTFMVFVMVGAHSGILYLLYFIKKYYKVEKLNYDTLNQFDSFISETSKLLRFLLILTIFCISMIPYFLIGEYTPLPLILLLKFCFSSIVFGFVLFAVVPIASLKFNIFPETFLLEMSRNIDQPEEISFHKDNKNIFII
jgi:hypothetical protein